MAERNLAILLRKMEPALHDAPHGFAVWHGAALPFLPFATISEAEGLTVVAACSDLKQVGLIAEPWARISLKIQSDLAAVGLTAAFAQALAADGISANVIAAVHHDHIFVPWDRRHDAMAALKALSRDD